MSDKMAIDPDAVDQASQDLLGIAEHVSAASAAASEDVVNALTSLGVGMFAFKDALGEATAFWSKRAGGSRERLEDAAEYLATNAAVARQHDNDTAADMVELEADTYISIDQYRQDDYYEQTGAARPERTGEDGAMSTGGESVAV
ncbi:type VII secretion target [Glycomyces niveus]|uniref:ESX-1 secretion-associated protein n=1 Tax=Glycomyces niveus TaxID=2820287 RepID=A0ABS3U4L8_9ACTN|nr:type VII secretion target [Glycomyces sp. NEAU-S30]MBO3733716.1 hypothetical protein [Glycomyces sp. NEAU-S30]